jgi:hypothetical protein
MVDINEFLNAECNAYAKQLLLRTIDEICKNGIEIESRELNFNVYDVTFYPKRNEVSIEFIIEPDKNPALVLPIDEFSKILANHHIS